MELGGFRASWEGVRASWEVLGASWEGPGASWEGKVQGVATEKWIFYLFSLASTYSQSVTVVTDSHYDQN